MAPCGTSIRWSKGLLKSKHRFNIYKLKEVKAKQAVEANQLRELDDALLSSLYQQLIYNDSCRSKHIEERLSNALSPHNHTGEGDVCDIWISYHNDFSIFYRKLEASFKDKNNIPHLDKIISDGFFCQSLRQGFGIEVKCSRTGRFPINKTQGEAMLSRFDKYCDPDGDLYLSLQNRLKISQRNRWSDFYLFVDLNDKLDIPENCIESITLVPTHELDDNYKNKDDISVSSVQALGKVIYKHDMKNIIWEDISSINSVVRCGVDSFVSNPICSQKLIERKIKLDKVKFTCYIENQKMMDCKQLQRKYEEINKRTYSDKLKLSDKRKN